MAHEEIIGEHVAWFARHKNFTPPTGDPKDCECGAQGDPKAGRALIANCPCCDGVQILTQELCNCTDLEAHKVKFKVVLPPDSTMRLRYIDATETIV